MAESRPAVRLTGMKSLALACTFFIWAASELEAAALKNPCDSNIQELNANTDPYKSDMGAQRRIFIPASLTNPSFKYDSADWAKTFRGDAVALVHGILSKKPSKNLNADIVFYDIPKEIEDPEEYVCELYGDFVRHNSAGNFENLNFFLDRENYLRTHYPNFLNPNQDHYVPVQLVEVGADHEMTTSVLKPGVDTEVFNSKAAEALNFKGKEVAGADLIQQAKNELSNDKGLTRKNAFFMAFKWMRKNLFLEDSADALADDLLEIVQSDSNLTHSQQAILLLGDLEGVSESAQKKVKMVLATQEIQDLIDSKIYGDIRLNVLPGEAEVELINESENRLMSKTWILSSSGSEKQAQGQYRKASSTVKNPEAVDHFYFSLNDLFPSDLKAESFQSTDSVRHLGVKVELTPIGSDKDLPSFVREISTDFIWTGDAFSYSVLSPTLEEKLKLKSSFWFYTYEIAKLLEDEKAAQADVSEKKENGMPIGTFLPSDREDYRSLNDFWSNLRRQARDKESKWLGIYFLEFMMEKETFLSKPRLGDERGLKERLDFLKGKAVLLVIGSPWCVPCRVSAKETERLYNRYKN